MKKLNKSVLKLRIHALLQRSLELEQEKQIKEYQKRMKPFLPEPIKITANPIHHNIKQLYDKNGKLFPFPKSKYHK